MVPIILGAIAIGSALYGTKKGYDAYEDYKKAEDINEQAQKNIKLAQKKIEKERLKAHSELESLGTLQLEIWQKTLNPMNERLSFIKNTPDHLPIADNSLIVTTSEINKQISTVSLQLQDYLDSIGVAGATGLATTFAALGGTTMFATASTGTAISTLSGAAATNATLAWLGGGAVATGGGGVALGTMILGGIAIGPALAVGGFVMSEKAKKAIAEAKSNLHISKLQLEEAKTAAQQLRTIARFSRMHYETLFFLNTHAQQLLNYIQQLIQSGLDDYNKLQEPQKKTLFLAYSLVYTLFHLLQIPILNEKGIVSRSIQTAIRDAKKITESHSNIEIIINELSTVVNQNDKTS